VPALRPAAAPALPPRGSAATALDAAAPDVAARDAAAPDVEAEEEPEWVPVRRPGRSGRVSGRRASALARTASAATPMLPAVPAPASRLPDGFTRAVGFGSATAFSGAGVEDLPTPWPAPAPATPAPVAAAGGPASVEASAAPAGDAESAPPAGRVPVTPRATPAPPLIPPMPSFPPPPAVLPPAALPPAGSASGSAAALPALEPAPNGLGRASSAAALAAPGAGGALERVAPAATAPTPPAPPAAPVAPVAPTAPAADTAPAAPTAGDVALVRRCLDLVSPRADRMTGEFYARLFLRHPDIRALFPAAMDVQRDRLFRALLGFVRMAADDPEALEPALSRLGVGHRKFGVRPEHFGPFGDALVESVRSYCGMPWNPALETAWRRVYGQIARTMAGAAERDARSAPACWQAEVVALERPVPEVAVVTVRTDQPYPFRAGQYASLETPWWPQVWRSYSLASAPRADGTLTFHVKAVPAGWVSNALVQRARPGDRLRVGPPLGRMTVDQQADAPLLLLGGGTGIAPMAAIVEEAAAHAERHGGSARTTELFYGARHDGGFYALPRLLELARRHRWLSVRPISGDTAPQRLSGLLPDVVRGLGPWDGYEALLSGPPAMVRRGVSALLDTGVRREMIKHDLED